MAFTQFLNIFQNIYNAAFPLKTKIITYKQAQKPWVNEILIKRMKIRDKLHKLANKNRIDRKIFTVFRNRLTAQLRQAKTKYYAEQFKIYDNNIKKTWDLINSVIKSKKNISKVSLSDEDGNYLNESTIPSKFVDHYTSIASQLTSKIPPSRADASTYLSNRVQQSFFLTPITTNEVSSVIDDLKNKGNKVNSVATSVLVDCKHLISPLIAHLIDLFVQQGYFPDNLKLGCISPIYKGGDKEKVNNYRPVCSLSPLSKIIEKVTYNRMFAYLDKHNILSSTQFGFRKNMSTETALLNYVDFIQKQLNDS